MLSLLGDSFAARVSASLLTASGLEGLVVRSLEEYEDLAVALATSERRKLEALRQQLQLYKQAREFPGKLFDPVSFAGDMEKLFAAMWAAFVQKDLSREPLRLDM